VRRVKIRSAESQKQFQLGDRFKILGTAGGPFQLDQLSQFDDPAIYAERLSHRRVRKQRLVGTGPDHFAQDVDRAERSSKREVQPPPKRLDIETEGQTGWRSAKVRFHWAERFHEPRQIFWSSPVDYIDVLRKARRTVRRRGDAADHDKLHFRLD
jgi:hypothetical protein